MNKTYLELFPGAGSGAIVGGWSRPILASTTITFTQAGTVVISMVGAGGPGAAANGTSGAATGGNSAPWGRKKFKVAIGDVMVCTMAAGISSPATNTTNGAKAGDSTVALNGVTILTVQGGEGGIYGGTTAIALPPTATVTGADFWVPGVSAGSATFAASVATTSGGAAVDLLQTGLGRSPNMTAANVAIGGSVGTNVGGNSLAWLALSDWGIVITEPSLASAAIAIPGRGGARSPAILPGAFAGSGDSSKSGYGAGGCGAQNGGSVQRSGDSYAYVTFTSLE
ncbi:hypothetical protein [Ottowia sp.]|uniref:hypothetical protein n=1 Tax=Ottowia sp. TaxID=1898956 RepID=UPI0025EAFBB0|nr:hypothetical protein [Ottowia sp.]